MEIGFRAIQQRVAPGDKREKSTAVILTFLECLSPKSLLINDFQIL